MSYIDRLIASCESAKAAKPTREFIFSDLSDLEGIRQAIYFIELLDGDAEQTFNAFRDFKNTKQRKCAKLNSSSAVLYVGSSTTGVKKRIQQHLGSGHKETYALHLSHWFDGNYKITVREYDVPNDVLQIIEDDLSDQLKPAFGKPGGNNK